MADGQLLCEIATDDRAASVNEALASVAQAQIEHEGALTLQNEILLAEAQVADRR